MQFSYSKISTYKQCPYKFKLLYIDKIGKPVVNEALIKGSKIHSLLENYESVINQYTENPQNLEYLGIVLEFAKSDIGHDILNKQSIREHCVKFDKDLNANDSLSKKETYLIGYIDRINLSSGIELIDYKTGKYKDPKFQDFEQLSIYGLYMFSKYPDIESILLRYVYVEHCRENSKLITRADSAIIKQLLINDLNQIQNEVEYPKKPQKLCDWCEFVDLCQTKNK